ncbi:MAG: DeoR/GlpR family DNA-binding transcription regulator [Oscillospiraceae bacterium]|nr:DeoR/GlpR family DNA-binding transcription regulator [Oscillospiraceae bacterium]
MNTIRREQMLEFIKAKKTVSLKELIQMFSDVSTMTIHRDLDYMEKKGVIERVRGGARYLPPEFDHREPAFIEREVANRGQKEIIARKAVSLIRSGSSIFIDSGTTTMALASLIEDVPLNVVTNSPNIAVALSDRSLVNLTLCGGTLEKRNLSLYGSGAVSTIEKINIDLAFVVPSGFTAESGFSCGNDGEAVVKSLICKKARSVALLIDSSKLDKVMPFTFASAEDIDYLICDKPLPSELSDALRQKGVSIL